MMLLLVTSSEFTVYIFWNLDSGLGAPSYSFNSSKE